MNRQREVLCIRGESSPFGTRGDAKPSFIFCRCSGRSPTPTPTRSRSRSRSRTRTRTRRGRRRCRISAGMYFYC